MLTAYADQVRELIRNNRTVEALAICKHILHYYPKHIEAYRQMGEVCLELGHYESAKELFYRVLSADPENVVAYVGLSTVFEQEHLIEEAVWHMERAFELTPGKTEMHRELLRLYNEAEGKPRARLKLTSGALAYVYVQEGLLAQAIQEFRAIVAAAPSRFDARVALAEALWQTGRIREAVEIAQNLLTQLPYCLKANLILGTAWKESDLPEAEKYLQRAQMLDPTNQTAVQMFGARSPLQPEQPRVPRYVEGAPPPPFPAQPVPGEPSREVAPAPAMPVEAVPIEAPVLETPPAAGMPVEPALVEARAAGLPAEAAPKPEMPMVSAPAEGTTILPPWLREEFPKAAEAAPLAPELPAQPTTVSPVELPPWLEQLQEAVAETPKAAQPELPEAAGEPTEAALPPWLGEQPGEVKPTEPSAVTAQVEELPAWLMQPGQAPAAAAPTVPAPEEKIEQALAEAEAAPRWLRGLQQPMPAEAVAPKEEPTVPVPPAPEEQVAEAPAAAAETALRWLRDLQAESKAAAEAAALQKESVPVEAPPFGVPEKIVPAPPMPAPVPVVSAPPAVEVPVAGEPAPAVAPAPKRKRQPKGLPHLVQARAHRDANRLGKALVEYDYVVQHAPRLVNEVIDDLEVLIQRVDTPLDTHRILGDAYTRADRLAEALERYRFVLDRVS